MEIALAVATFAASAGAALAVVQTRVQTLEKRIEGKVGKDVVNAKLETLAVKIDGVADGITAQAEAIKALHTRMDRRRDGE